MCQYANILWLHDRVSRTQKEACISTKTVKETNFGVYVCFLLACVGRCLYAYVCVGVYVGSTCNVYLQKHISVINLQGTKLCANCNIYCT